ncbi:MBL fold metallo-hydrolase [Novosphingobium rosa]|uniref:MBL fold metallo-hydrolase n=1 Tax=Novosphingobium rosa TaxID=76978 RepID=UPI000836CC7B|nr:MBL fold metallo-hydrolase [Novosphingobium rosa]
MMPATRRLLAATAFALAAALAAAPGWAQTGVNAFKGPITTTAIGGGLYQLSAGSNAVLAVGADGAILIDSLFNDPAKLVASVEAVTPRPVKLLVNTHAHLDHTAGNAIYAGKGARIVSTSLAAGAMQQPFTGGDGTQRPPIDKAGWPTTTYDKVTTLSIPGQSLRFIPVRNAHGEGDAMVFFPKANVLVLGDLHHSHEYPVWDAVTGCKCGSYEGNLQVYRQALKLADARTKIVPGHGGLTNKAEVTAYVAMLERVRGQVKALIARGKSKDEVVAAKLLADDHSPQPGGPDNRDNFIATLYTALQTGVGA